MPINNPDLHPPTNKTREGRDVGRLEGLMVRMFPKVIIVDRAERLSLFKGFCCFCCFQTLLEKVGRLDGWKA